MKKPPLLRTFDPFQLFILTNPDLVAEFQRVGNLGDCIGNDYVWKVPLMSGGYTSAVATLAETEAQHWKVGDFGIKTKEEEYGLLGDAGRIAELLAVEKLQDISDAKAVALPMYHTSILYVRAADQEYAVVLSPVRFADLVVHKAYRAEDLVGALEAAFGTGSLDGQVNGGVASSNDASDHWQPYHTAGLLVTVCGLLAYGLYVRRAKLAKL
jgi:hypothetical protein